MTPPTRYALVPALPFAWHYTEFYTDRPSQSCIVYEEPDPASHFGRCKITPLYAPDEKGGAVTAADLERAARARSEWAVPGFWEFADEVDRQFHTDAMRAALTAIGLPVADAPAGEVENG